MVCPSFAVAEPETVTTGATFETVTVMSSVSEPPVAVAVTRRTTVEGPSGKDTVALAVEPPEVIVAMPLTTDHE